MIDDAGVQRPIPCDKAKIGTVLLQMLSKRREYYLGSGDLFMFRMWTALSCSIMQGLPQHDMSPSPLTVADFLTANHLNTARDEENAGSGFSPLIWAALSGNVEVVRELIASHNVDVNSRLLSGSGADSFGMEKGMDALGIAAYLCPQNRVHDVVSTLLEAGADVNSRFSSGGTPLIAAVAGQSEEGVRALLACGRNVDLEIGIKINHATAINIAGILGTYPIVEALINAGADTSHRSTKFANCAG